MMHNCQNMIGGLVSQPKSPYLLDWWALTLHPLTPGLVSLNLSTVGEDYSAVIRSGGPWTLIWHGIYATPWWQCVFCLTYRALVMCAQGRFDNKQSSCCPPTLEAAPAHVANLKGYSRVESCSIIQWMWFFCPQSSLALALLIALMGKSPPMMSNDTFYVIGGEFGPPAIMARSIFFFFKCPSTFVWNLGEVLRLIHKKILTVYH